MGYDAYSITNVITMNQSSLVHSWIQAQKIGVDNPGYKKHSWAADEFINAAIDQPEKLFLDVMSVLKTEDSDLVLKAIGAGPLEDLLIYHGEWTINRLRQEVTKCPALRQALREVWLDDEDGSIKEQLRILIREFEK